MKRISLAFLLMLVFGAVTTTMAQSETRYTTTAARVRTCQYLTCTIITTLNRNTEIEVLDTVEGALANSSAEWYEIEINGRTGYIHSTLTTSRAPATVATSSSSGGSSSSAVSSVTATPVPNATVAPPAPPVHPAGASALCNDGTYSYSAHRRGTCSHHGGVKEWLKSLPA